KPWVLAVPQEKVKSHAELQQRLQAIVRAGGEGLMLHRGASLYLAERNDDLLKLKTHNDAEAKVLAHLPGKGNMPAAWVRCWCRRRVASVFVSAAASPTRSARHRRQSAAGSRIAIADSTTAGFRVLRLSCVCAKMCIRRISTYQTAMQRTSNLRCARMMHLSSVH